VRVIVEHTGGARRGQRQEFASGQRLRFGRHPENEIAFDAHRDLDASTRHAELRYEDGGYWLVDVGSSNGTFVGGARVTRQEVSPGHPVDVEFGAGGPRCRVLVGDAAVPPETLVHSGRAAAAGPPGAPGSRTVAMMVQNAMEEAQRKHAAGMGRSTTTFVKSMVDQALHRSTLRFKLALGLLALALVGGVVGFLLWNARVEARRRADRAAEAARREAEERDREVMLQAIADAKKQQDQLLAEGPGPRIVRENRDAIYLLATVEPDGSTQRAFCTGFAVTPEWLATNAHCVEEIVRLQGAGSRPFAVRSGEAHRPLPVVQVAKHGGYTASKVQVSIDVGLVKLGGEKLPRQVKLAGRDHLTRLETGTRMFTYGFPGRLADPRKPEATLTEGIIGRITRLSGEVGAFEDNLLVQHSAFTTGGTSGSPVFDAAGQVIAVNAGGYVGQQKQVIVDPTTGETKVVDVGATLAGYNYGIRIDALAGLMQDKGLTK